MSESSLDAKRDSTQLSTEDRQRIRAEEQLRREIQAEFAPAPKAQSKFDRFVTLLNTNVGIGTIAAVLLAVATWAFTQIDDQLHKDERKDAAARAKALVDVQHVSPFLPMLAKADSAERALACRVLAHMITNKVIDQALGVGLAEETGNCVAEQARKEAAAPDAGTTSTSSVNTILAVDRREETRGYDLSTTGADIDASTLKSLKANTAQAALARSLPRRLYIQYVGPQQAELVEQLRELCRSKGWLVPAAESVGNKAPRELQVRYFNEADAETAQSLLETLRNEPPFSQLPSAAKATYLKLNAPPGQVEVWLPQT